jgi:DNA-binding MarR family transcriptional regulator
MNVILTNLETAGLVVRRPHPEHGCVLQTYLTEMGEDSVAKAHGLVEAVEAVEGRMLDGLRQDDRRRLSEALRSCADALEGGSECAAAGAKDGLNAKVAGAHSSPS